MKKKYIALLVAAALVLFAAGTVIGGSLLGGGGPSETSSFTESTSSVVSSDGESHPSDTPPPDSSANDSGSSDGSDPQSSGNDNSSDNPQSSGGDNSSDNSQSSGGDNSSDNSQSSGGDNSSDNSQSSGNDNSSDEPQSSGGDNSSDNPQSSGGDNSSDEPQSSGEDNSSQPPPESETTPPETSKPPDNPSPPSPPYVITPVAYGTEVYSNSDALIDAGSAGSGYLMIKLNGARDGVYKIVIDSENSGARYTYQLNSYGNYEVIPLTEGSGRYTVYVLKQVAENKGSTVIKQDIDVNISDEFLPFLTPNQYCMYDAGYECVTLASELCGGKNELEKVAAIYDYVINNISYVSTAENAAAGYVPDPDRTLKTKSGICFDYTSLITAMLRTQRIPTRVVVGYAGTVYHAWISVYVEGAGWIDGAIYFNGSTWNRMDPTFAAGTNSEESYNKMINYISDNSNYLAMYYY